MTNSANSDLPYDEKYYDTCKTCNQKVMTCKCNKTYEELESEWMMQQHEIAGLRMKLEAWEYLKANGGGDTLEQAVLALKQKLESQ